MLLEKGICARRVFARLAGLIRTGGEGILLCAGFCELVGSEFICGYEWAHAFFSERGFVIVFEVCFLMLRCIVGYILFI